MLGSIRRCFLSGIGLLLLMQSVGVLAQASEAGLRVAFVYNFLKFIQWPSLQGSELMLCALSARDTTRQSLTQLDNKRAHTVTVKVVFLDDPQQLKQQVSRCQLVYVPVTGAAMPLPTTLPAGTLLVVDEPDPADGRVGIALNRTPQDRIEFTINEQAVKHSGVKISSQLLKLAKNKPGGAS